MNLKINENVGVIKIKLTHTWGGKKVYTGCLEFEK
jgi:hypothetical protein